MSTSIQKMIVNSSFIFFLISQFFEWMLFLKFFWFNQHIAHIEKYCNGDDE